MAPMQTVTVHPDALELAELLRPSWPTIRAGIRASGVPTCEGDEGDGETGDEAGAAGAGDESGAEGDAGDGDGGQDWKSYARKHERAAKAARKELDELRAKLKEQEDASKSDQEKALEQARREAGEAARSEVTKELRSERLTAAFARLAAAKVADVDDALKLLDVDEDTVFDDEGKVQTDALKDALADLLERKPYLKAQAPGPGENDAGKGSGRGKGPEDMSVEDHLAQIRRK